MFGVFRCAIGTVSARTWNGRQQPPPTAGAFLKLKRRDALESEGPLTTCDRSRPPRVRSGGRLPHAQNRETWTREGRVFLYLGKFGVSSIGPVPGRAHHGFGHPPYIGEFARRETRGLSPLARECFARLEVPGSRHGAGRGVESRWRPAIYQIQIARQRLWLSIWQAFQKGIRHGVKMAGGLRRLPF